MIACFFLGMFCGGVVIATLAGYWFREQDRWYNRRLDYWANVCTDLSKQVHDLDARLREEQTEADWWKGDDND